MLSLWSSYSHNIIHNLPHNGFLGGGNEVKQVSGRFHFLCGRFGWDLPICCVLLS